MKNIFCTVAALSLSLSISTNSAIAHDKSNEAIDKIYKIFQEHARTEAYIEFQQDLIKNGSRYFQLRVDTHVFMSTIESGDFDDDLRIKTDLVACAARSASALANKRNIPSDTPLIAIANQAAQDIRNATQGQSNKTDCKHVFDDYDGRYNIYLKNTPQN